MNRDIEFRAYIKNENIMINVPIIDFRKSAKCIRTIYGQTNASEWKYKFDDIILMQYTGLKDKNGKKIFEGDIIDIHQTVNGYNQFVIEYDKYKFSARYYNQDKKQTGSWYGYDLDELFEINESEKEIEVIGNIYENKELLEG